MNKRKLQTCVRSGETENIEPKDCLKGLRNGAKEHMKDVTMPCSRPSSTLLNLHACAPRERVAGRVQQGDRQTARDAYMRDLEPDHRRKVPKQR
jgi:hypothetical protein